MPTITKKLYRTFCKTCNDFVLHDSDEINENLVCCECSTIFTSITYGEIPSDKLNDQRKRWKESEKKKFRNMFSMYSQPSISHLFSEVKGESIEIIESDAGQKKIDEINSQDRKKIKEESISEILKYKSVERNSTCLCGSGKKYKKCCFNRISELVNKYRV